MKDGNTSVYAHLDKFNQTLEIFVDDLQEKCNCFSIDHTFLPNQYPVKKGDVIGFTGDSGSLSGPHIHFEIRNKKGPSHPRVFLRSDLPTTRVDKKHIFLQNIVFCGFLSCAEIFSEKSMFGGQNHKKPEKSGFG